MTRRCSVCAHPERPAIDTALVAGTPYRTIAARFSVTTSALQRHRAAHLAQLLSGSGDDRARVSALMDELSRCMERVELLLEACDEWLRDPDDPSCYSLAPRVEDIRVVVTGPAADGRSPRRTIMPLADIIRPVEDGGWGVERVQFTQADPRDLLLKALRQRQRQLRLLLEAAERLYDARQVETFETIVLTAIGEVAPEVRERIEDSLRRHRPDVDAACARGRWSIA